MNFIISASTDIGLKKPVNQDSFFTYNYKSENAIAAVAVVCDGISGMKCGDIASRALAQGFENWTYTELPKLMGKPIEDSVIREQWSKIVKEKNKELYERGLNSDGFSGTTVTAILITPARYYLLNIGDTRGYELYDNIVQLTEDHTVAAEEIRLGNIKPEQAINSPFESMLTKCVGGNSQVYPDMFFGDTKQGAVYMLCCDGFRHKVSEWEIYNVLMQGKDSEEKLNNSEKYLIELNKQRGEKDNITVIAISVI